MLQHLEGAERWRRNVWCLLASCVCRDWPTLKHIPQDSSVPTCRATNSRTAWWTSCLSSPPASACSQSEGWRAPTTSMPASLMDIGRWSNPRRPNKMCWGAAVLMSEGAATAQWLRLSSWISAPLPREEKQGVNNQTHTGWVPFSCLSSGQILARCLSVRSYKSKRTVVVQVSCYANSTYISTSALILLCFRHTATPLWKLWALIRNILWNILSVQYGTVTLRLMNQDFLFYSHLSGCIVF